jgi:hypothetical protein
LKVFKDMMAFLMKIDAARRLATHSGWSNGGTFKFSRFGADCVEGNRSEVRAE